MEGTSKAAKTTRFSKAEHRTTLIALAFLVIVAWNGFGLVSPPSDIQVASPGPSAPIVFTQTEPQSAAQGGFTLALIGPAGAVSQAAPAGRDLGLISNIAETTFTITTYTQGGLYLECRRRRSRLEIYVQIIEQLLTGPSSITEIALNSKTNFSLAKEYIEFLLGKGLVKKAIRDGKLCYTATPDGIQFRDRAEVTLRVLR